MKRLLALVFATLSLASVASAKFYVGIEAGYLGQTVTDAYPTKSGFSTISTGKIGDIIKGNTAYYGKGFAIAGILIKAFWVYCPKWVSSVLYIGMGWTCVLAFTQLLNNLSPAAFGWLLAGGIIYTVGGVIYALKLPLFNSRHKNFGSHEIFHLFVMAGSACHFVVMYAFLLP